MKDRMHILICNTVDLGPRCRTVYIIAIITRYDLFNVILVRVITCNEIFHGMVVKITVKIKSVLAVENNYK